MQKAAAAMALWAACSGIKIQDYTHTGGLIPLDAQVAGNLS